MGKIKIRKLYEKAQEKSIFAGVIIIDLLAVIFFAINPVPIFIPGDLPLVLSLIMGLLFSMKNKKKERHPFYVSLIVGPVGAILASFSISLMMYIISSELLFNDILFITLLVGVGLSIMLSGLFGVYFWFKEERK